MDKTHREEDRGAGRFSFRARPVAVWSMAFAFSSLATLAVVVGTGNDDALASIALALAIFAFALQIVFFVIQIRTAADQDRRSADLYRDTSAVLTKIEERSAATVEVIREQFGFVLRHALGVRLESDESTANGDAELVPTTDRSNVGTEDSSTNANEVAATVGQIEAIVNRAVRNSINPDLLTRWQEISSPRATSSNREEIQSKSRDFDREVRRMIVASTAGRPTVNTRRVRGGNEVLPHYLVEDGEARGIVKTRSWTSAGISPAATVRMLEYLAEMLKKSNATTAVLVLPTEPAVSATVRKASATLGVQVVSIDDFASMLADGWPRSSHTARDSSSPSEASDTSGTPG